MIRKLSASLLAVALASCTANAPLSSTASQAQSAPAGAVSAADPRAQAAGEEMLARGGSATDAAIAVMLALTVVEPQSSGIGGGGFMVRGEADGTVSTFDGRETAPAGATPEWFLDENGEVPPYIESVRSGLSVGVPGNIALAAKAHAAHGKLPWATLFGPAIDLARQGFEINPRLRGSLDSAKDRSAHSAEARSIFFDAEGNPLPLGTTIKNERLAKTFEAIASAGPEAFYAGDTAQEIAAAVAADTPHSGAMTYNDITSYEAKQRDAICGSYRDYRICTMGPPTSGGVAVLQILGQLERFDLAALGPRNPVVWHLFVESQRLAYADRELYLADADFVSVPVAGLLAPDYIATRSRLIDEGNTLTEAVAGIPAGASMALSDGDEPEEHGTSHFAVVDADNTMISYTSTIEGAFGSGLMVNGFFLNNELTDFSRSPMVDGKLVANRVEGGKRPRSSMSPTIIWDPQGKPFLAVGAAGGGTIPVQTARSIIGAIDFGMSAEEILGLPFIMAFGDRVMVEQGTWMEEQMAAFQSLGHKNVFAREAPVKAGAVLHDTTGWHSARDPRLVGQIDTP
ncbi:gamma-glutamyltransferase [Qipengyuania qiaonensis]|uniref:Glutathione hydrolase proenzyme n=1 Tax=Qipengyuania qiaonensis TaxID=2867240 RepID=A0ABS7JB12_9SPHN|nr:gamma-glutamyltransferase [Qipengyuania qiaonensis]MBX7482202.1 gamma-glutamyltransferase [Qipengyuania qiaonensis]